MLNNLINNKPYILFLAFGLLIFVVAQFFGFDGLYGQDSYEYLRYSEKIKEYVFGGELPGLFSWPIGYPAIIAVIDIVINNTIISAQLISIFGLVGCCIVSLKFINLLYPDVKNKISFFYVFIFVGFSPYLFRLGVSSMSDLLCAFFVLSSFYYFYKFFPNNTYKYLSFSIILGTLSIVTRNGAILLMLIPVFISFFILIKNKKYSIIIVSALIIAILLLPTFLNEKSQVLGGGMEVFKFSFSNFFSNKMNGLDGSFYYSIPNFIYGFYGFFHPAYFFIGLFLVVVIIFKKIKIYNILLYSIILYSLFIASIYFQNKRFLVIQFPLIAVLLFPSFNYLSEKVKKKVLFFLLGISFFINTGLTIYTTQKAYDFQQTDLRIAKLMRPYQNNKLYTFWIDVSLKGRGLDFDYTNFWYGEINKFDKGGLVLFNETKFEQQWKGHAVMNNWYALKKDYQLHEIRDLKQGWKLYEIK
jgi:hypothetical protein